MRRHYLISVVAGWALWLILVAITFAYEPAKPYIPKALRDTDLPDFIATVVGVAAVPVAIGGWLFVWGDGGQPPDWVTGVPFNVAVGLVLYGALGAVAGLVFHRWSARKAQAVERIKVQPPE